MCLQLLSWGICNYFMGLWFCGYDAGASNTAFPRWGVGTIATLSLFQQVATIKLSGIEVVWPNPRFRCTLKKGSDPFVSKHIDATVLILQKKRKNILLKNHYTLVVCNSCSISDSDRPVTLAII